MIDGSDVAWSCVVDDTPEIWSSIVPWLATAIELARIVPSQIHVHHVCALRPEIAEFCRTRLADSVQVLAIYHSARWYSSLIAYLLGEVIEGPRTFFGIR